MHESPARKQNADDVSNEEKDNHLLIVIEPQIEEEIKQQDLEVKV